MLLSCPQCHKTLNVPDAAIGKKVRCPGCKQAVPVPAGGAASQSPAPAKAPPGRPTPAAGPPAAPAATRPRPDASRPKSGEGPSPPKEDGDAAQATMRCPMCQAAAVVALPANQFSRRPGYSCAECGAIMRREGTGGTLVFIMILGAAFILLGLTLTALALGSDRFRSQMIGGAAGIADLGFAVAGWSFKQWRLPEPLDAPHRPSRLGLWIGILLAALLIIGGGAFFFMYFLHEML